MKMPARLFVALLMCCVTLPVSQAASRNTVPKELAPINLAVSEVTTKFYDESAHYLFGPKAHFEYRTIPYVLEAMVKVPLGVDPGLEVVRGPQKGGYWLDMEVREGFRPYPRAEGKSDRGEFLEYVYYPQLKGGKKHLYIVLRIPSNDKQAMAMHDELMKTLKPFCAPATE